MAFDTKEQEQIRRAFDAIVSDVGPAPDLERLTQRRRVVRSEPSAGGVSTSMWRPAWYAAAAAVTVMLAIGTVALLALNDGSRNGDVAVVQSGPLASDAGFPNLLVDVDRLPEGPFDLAVAADEVASTEVVSHRLQTFGEPDSGPTSPRIWLVTLPDGSDFFRGDAFEEPGWQSVSIGRGRAFIKTGPLGSTVMWEAGGGPDGTVIIAHALLIEPNVLTDVILGLEETNSGWTPRDLPEGFVALYSGPDRATFGERSVVLIWVGARDGMKEGEITLSLLDSGSNGGERDLYSAFGSNVSAVNEISETEIRGHPALRIDGQGGTLYQWMEAPAVVARLLVQGPIDPQHVADALVDVDESTWEATVRDPIADQGISPTTTFGPTTTVAR